MPELPDPALRGADTHFRQEVDNSAWDGPAALSRCASSDAPASCYRAICAGRKAGDAELQSSWALPHHKTPDSPPNAAGTRNALSRLPQTEGLTNETAARAHLERHMSAINPDRGKRDEPKQGLFRMVPNALARAEVNGDGNTLAGFAAVTDTWTEIDSVFKGTFRERIQPGAFKKTITENGDRVKVLFNHGMDPQIGSKPLGKPVVIEERDGGLWTETPLDHTSYNADLKELLRSGALDGMSFQFDVLGESWDMDTEDGTDERTITEVKLYEFGPVTWPAYETTTAGIRSKGVYGKVEDTKAVPPKDEGRSTEESAAAPADEGRDTSVDDAHRAVLAGREEERRAFDTWLQREKEREEAEPRRWFEK